MLNYSSEKKVGQKPGQKGVSRKTQLQPSPSHAHNFISL